MLATLKAALVRLISGAILLTIAALFCLGAFGWFSAALYLALEGELNPPAAALLTGLAVLAMAGLLATIAWYWPRAIGRRSRRGTSPPQAATADVVDGADLAASLGRASAQFIGSHGKSAAFGAFVTGFAIGAKPGLGQALGRRILDILR